MYKYLLLLTVVLPVEKIEKELRKQKVEETEIEKIRQRYCKFVRNVDKVCKEKKKEDVVNAVHPKNQGLDTRK